MVDNVVSTIDNALAKKGLTMKAVERWKEEMPREEEMRPKDKYTMFDRKEKRYRKGIHSKPISPRHAFLVWIHPFHASGSSNYHEESNCTQETQVYVTEGIVNEGVNSKPQS